MPPKSLKAEELRDKSFSAQVVELVLSGKSLTQVAEELNCTRNVVQDALEEGLNSVRELLIDKVQRLVTISMARMEILIQAGMPYAVGQIVIPEKLRDQDDPETVYYPPDKDWNKIVAGHIKLELELAEKLVNISAKQPQDDGGTVQTIASHDPLYELAQMNMEKDWLGDFADLQAADLLPPGEEAVADAVGAALPLDKKIKTAKKQVDKLLKVVGEPEPEEESE